MSGCLTLTARIWSRTCCSSSLPRGSGPVPFASRSQAAGPFGPSGPASPPVPGPSPRPPPERVSPWPPPVGGGSWLPSPWPPPGPSVWPAVDGAPGGLPYPGSGGPRCCAACRPGCGRPGCGRPRGPWGCCRGRGRRCPPCGPGRRCRCRRGRRRRCGRRLPPGPGSPGGPGPPSWGLRAGVDLRGQLRRGFADLLVEAAVFLVEIARRVGVLRGAVEGPLDRARGQGGSALGELDDVVGDLHGPLGRRGALGKLNRSVRQFHGAGSARRPWGMVGARPTGRSAARPPRSYGGRFYAGPGPETSAANPPLQ